MNGHSLLLITDSFPPGFAPRMGYLCKYLVSSGRWTVDVVARSLGDTSHSETFQHLSGFARNVWRYEVDDGIHALSLRAAIGKICRGQMAFGRGARFLASKIAYAIVGLGVGFDIRSKIREAVAHNKYDLVLASSGGGQMSGPAFYAARLAKVPCVLDFRDLHECHRLAVTFWCDRREWFRRKHRNGYIRRVKRLVTVIDQYVTFISAMNPNVSLVRNGYDPEVFREILPVKTDRFRLSYIGSVYDTMLWKPFSLGMQLFLDRLSKEDRGLVSIDFWATRQTYEKSILPFLNGVPESLIHYHKPVPQTKIPSVFAETSIAIDLSHNRQGFMEAVHTKLYEYFAMNRPILNISHRYEGDAERMIAELNAGKVAVTAVDVAEFLQEKYSEWRANGCVRGTIPAGAAEKYSRCKLSSEFEEILLQVCSEVC